MKIKKNVLRMFSIVLLIVMLAVPTAVIAANNSNENTINDANQTTQVEKNKVSKNTKAAITDNIFTDITLYKNDGTEIQTTDNIQNGSGVKANFVFSFSGKNYQTGDTFTTQLPSQFNITTDISGQFSPMTSAKWDIDATTKTLTITFLEDNIAAEEYELSLTTSWLSVVNDSDKNQKLSFDTAPTSTVYNLTIDSSLTSGLSKIETTLEDDFNPKRGTTEGQFNLDRSTDSNRSFEIRTTLSNGKLNLSNIKVYSSIVNYNGNLEGTSTLLSASDYDLSITGQDGNQPTVKVTMKNQLDGKAIIITADIIGIDGKSYIDLEDSGTESNYFYTYQTTYKGTGNLYSPTSDSDRFYTGHPLKSKGVRNKDTAGVVDWTIEYNFDEQPLNTASVLNSLLDSTDVEYVAGSLQIIKADLTHVSSNNFTVTEGASGLSDWTYNMENDQFEMHPNKNTTQAYIIKYSTKVKNPDLETITNTVSNGTDKNIVPVSLQANLLHKESAAVDLYNQTMTWEVTVNEDKYALDDAVIHDYFINPVIDYTDVKVEKMVTDTKRETLVVGTDYKLAEFDENGDPTGARPNVNGAPEAFNGGVRLDFINDYAVLEDTIIITITTKLDVTSQTTSTMKIQNKATLNYGSTPGVIEYDASGDYTNPYYNGGIKESGTNTEDSEYIYQHWLILVNANAQQHASIKLEDTMPAGLELIPSSLKYDEVVSQNMLDNLSTYIKNDNNLASTGDDVYPTSVNTSGNALNLEFNNLGKKRVYVKYQTRVKKQWYIGSKSYTNTAKITFDSKSYTFAESRAISNYEYALSKRGEKEQSKDNVINWTLSTMNVSQYLPVENPVIQDSLNNEGTNTIYDSTSFVVTELGNSERIDSKYYDIELTDGSFTITFKNYTATKNISVSYRTISEFPGSVLNGAIISSLSYGALSNTYRSVSGRVDLSFSSGSGTGIVKTGGFTITKVDSANSTKLLPNAVFEIYTEANVATGLKATTDSSGQAKFDFLPYGKYLLKEITAPDKYEISTEYKNGKLIEVSNDFDKHSITVTNSLAPTPADVELKKIDNVTKLPLAGATFKIVDKNGVDVATNLVTDSDGLIKQTLLSGEYRFIETNAPVYYQLDSTPVPFTLTIGQTTKTELEMENIKIPAAHVMVHHRDINDKIVADSVRLEGEIGTIFKSEAKVIKGHKLKEIIGPRDVEISPVSKELRKTLPAGHGNFKEVIQEVIYVYEPVEDDSMNIIDDGKDAGGTEESENTISEIPETGSNQGMMVVLSLVVALSILGVTSYRKRYCN